MAIDLIMPKLGLTMEEGMLVRWLAAEGDPVKKGQAVLEVESDKATIEVEAPASGLMGPLLVDAGQTVPLTTLLARIYAPGEEIPRQAQAGEKSPGPDKTGPEEKPVARITPLARRIAEKEGLDLSDIPARKTDRRLRAKDVQAARARRDSAGRPGRRRVFSSPRARKRAGELGLDWRALPGSGPRGRVVEKDVLAAARVDPRSNPPPFRGRAREGVTWQTPTTVQRLTAERMVASFGSAPHFYLGAEVRATALLAVRKRLLPLVEERVGVRLTITDLLLRILGAALAEYPRANAFWDEGRFALNRPVNVGLAVATEAGLIVPVIHQAGRKSLSQIALERARLVERARAGKLAADELSGGTFTLTNLGMFPVDTFQAILNPPQSAILAVGRIAERPVVVDGQLAVSSTALLSLSCDHRVLDGALAAQFLGRVVELVEEPYGLLV